MILNHRNININGIDYHFAENKVDKPKGEVVFIHGIGGNYREFLPLMRLMYREYNFIALDLPGFGRSEALKNFMINNLIADISELIAFLGYTNTIIIGHSLGGDISYLVTAGNKDIKKMVIFNSPILNIHIPKPAIDYLTALAKLPNNSPLIDVITALKNSKLGAGFIDKIVANYIDKGVKTMNRSYNYNYAAESIGEANANAAIEYCKFLINLDLTEQIKSIQIPALCFFGDEDQNVSVSAYEYLKSINPKIQAVMLDNFDHGGVMIQPERVMEYLSKFI